MLDIGWSEMAVIALIALIVLGPKELPQAMRSAAKWMRKARSLAREFQSGVDDMIREAELEDARKAIDATRDFDVDRALEETVDPTGTVREEASDLDRTARGQPDETRRTDATPEASADATPDGEEGRATVVKQPVNVAPPHSLKPPAEDAPAESPAGTRTETPAETATSTAGRDTSQRSA